MPDTEVIDHYLQHQAQKCFQLLYERYARKIYSKCLTMLQDSALAEDATQEIFTKVFLNISRFGGRSKFSTWVYSVTYNYCIDYIRKGKKHKELFTEEPERLPDRPDELLDQALFEMEVVQLKSVLAELNGSDRAILLMKYQDELSIKDIAEILEKSESAVKMQIKRAKERAVQLRKKLFNE